MSDSVPLRPTSAENAAKRFQDDLTRGVSPWRRISRDTTLLPVSGLTGREFRGINRWVLATAGRNDPRWYTREQAEHLGATLSDGERGEKLFYWRTAEKISKADGSVELRKLEKPTLQIFTLFNAEQFDGLPPLGERPPKACDYEAVRDILKLSGATFKQTTAASAYFSAEEDLIYVPPLSAYPSREERLSDVLHELVGWFNAPARNAGQGVDEPIGSNAWVRQSMTAEMASLLIESALGLPHSDDKNRAFYSDWADLLADNPLSLMKIAADAEKSADRVLGLIEARDRVVNRGLKLPIDWSGRTEVAVHADEPGYDVLAVCKDGRKEFLTRLSTRAQAEDMAWQVEVLYGMEASTEREYIVVPWEEREQVRKFGAKFDPSAKAWYIPDGLPEEKREKLEPWRPKSYRERRAMIAHETFVRAKDALPSERLYLQVPFTARARVKAAGAIYDGRHQKAWYISKKGPFEGVAEWLPEEYKAVAEKYFPEGMLKERMRLAVPYEETMLAKSHGAVWDPKERSWFAPAGSMKTEFEKWLRAEPRIDSSQSPTESFRSLLLSMGFDPERNGPVVLDGEKHRFILVTDKHGKASGEYRAYADARPAGSARNFQSGEYRTWVYQAKDNAPMPPERLAELRKAAEEARARRQQETAQKRHAAALRAAKFYESLPVNTLAHQRDWTPYEKRKGLNAGGMMPLCGRTDDKERLVLPVFDVNGKIWSVQTIEYDGSKRFIKDGRKRGCFSGAMATNTKWTRYQDAPSFIVCEGYATAMSVSEAMQQPVIIAFDAGNLQPVCEALHERYPHKPILIAGDDDLHRELAGGINPGREKAEAAAKDPKLEGMAAAVFPVFAPNEAGTKEFTDFNDLASKSVFGPQAVKNQISAGLSELMKSESVLRAAHEQRLQAAEAEYREKRWTH